MDGIIVLLLIVGGLLIATAIFQVLWNTTMPELFGLKQIAYWTALRLLLLAGFLSSGGIVRFMWRA